MAGAHPLSAVRQLLLASMAALPLLGCQSADPSPPPPARAVAAPEPGFVTDMAAFERFIAGRPAPAEFRQRYPDVLLVLPGDITTFELRSDNSRFIAELDDEGRITGGRFQ